MKVDDVKNCSFQNWYQNFQNVTFESIVIPLPDGFISYILKDGIVLPESSKNFYSHEANNSDSEDSWDDTEDSNEIMAPSFPVFDEQIISAIRELGGKVFPKLNWSSPKDASWIAFNNSCCCTTVSDIYLLLKSSDFVIHDLTKPYHACKDYVPDTTNPSLMLSDDQVFLVLRKWVEIDTSGEFRCFVKDNTLIGICQREHSLYFEHINAEKKNIVQDITEFFQAHIQFKFPCSDYVFDVHRKKKACVNLIDFNPFGKVTDSLLFDWAELLNGLVKKDECNLPEFRYVAINHGVQPRLLSYHAIPRDIVDISTGEDSLKLVDLIRLNIDEQNKKFRDDDEPSQENGNK